MTIIDPLEDIVVHLQHEVCRGDVTLTFLSNAGMAFELYESRFSRGGQSVSPCCGDNQEASEEFPVQICQGCGAESQGRYWFVSVDIINRERWMYELTMAARTKLDPLMAALAADAFVALVEHHLTLPVGEWASANPAPLLH